jgi:RNA polymerase sigma-70 factor, ECF subfamily
MTFPAGRDADDAPERADFSDPAALGRIYEQYAHAIYRYIYSRVRDAQLAEDLTADVFLRMIETIDRYEDRGWPISAWLYRIAHDRVIDTLRRKRRRLQIPLEDWGESCDDPDIAACLSAEHQNLRGYFFRLTHSQRTVLWLRFVDECSLQEVASKLGISEGAVKALQHRGLRALARMLREEEPHSD